MSVDARDQAEKVRAIERAIHLAHSSHYIVGLNAEKELAALLAELASLKDALRQKQLRLEIAQGLLDDYDLTATFLQAVEEPEVEAAAQARKEP